MKKLALLAAVLLLFGLTAGFAEVGADISGEASATFGFNLEDQSAGFENDGSVDVIFTFVEEQTIDSGMMDGWYGWIEFADFSVIYDNDDDSDYYQQGWYWDDDNEDEVVQFNNTEFALQTQIMVTEPDITAKITNGMIYIVLYEAPSFEPDHAEPVEDDEDDDYSAEDDDSGYEPDLSEYGGITIGYDAEAFDVEVYAASGTGYADGDGNDSWLFGAMVAVSAAGADLSADFALASGVDDDDIVFGADAAYTLDAGMVAIAPYVGVDYWMSDVIDPGVYELAAGVDCTFTNDDAFNVAFYLSDMTDDLDFEVTFTEDGEAGFVPGLDAELFFGGYDTFDDYRVGVDLGYMLGDIRPFAGFGIDNLDGTSVYDASAGIEWSGFANTVVTVEWSTDDLENHIGTIEVGAEVSM
jgi:hypothetical protein